MLSVSRPTKYSMRDLIGDVISYCADAAAWRK